MPEVCWRIAQGSRADGMLCSSSLVKVCLVPVSLVSTIGLVPDRHCFLDRGDPIRALTRASKPTVTWMPSLTTVLKLRSSNVTR